MSARKPEYVLKAIDPKTGDKSGRIGAGWVNDDGSVSIKLDMCVYLNASEGYTYMLFPNDKPANVRPIKEK